MANSRQSQQIQSAIQADMPPYMRKDGHGYKFVRPIPKKLRSTFGKANFIQRLGKNFSDAKRQCLELAVATEKQLDLAKQAIANASSVEDFLRLSPPDRLQRIKFSEELAGSLSSLWLQSLDADAQARASGERSDEEHESLEENIPQMTATIRKALATGRVDAFHNAVHQLLMFKGYELDATDDEWQKLTSTVLKSFLAGYTTLAARQNGEQLDSIDVSNLPPPLRAKWEVTTAPRRHTLSEIYDSYAEYLKKQNSKTRSTKLSIFGRFVQFVGIDKPANSITSADIYNFIEHRINSADTPWSHKYATVRAKNALLEAFARATTMNLIEQNPVNGVDILPKRDPKKEKQHLKPRYPFTAAQLNTVFTSEWYQPTSKAFTGRMRSDLGARYWIPLICMYHGFRVTEAAQLRLEDIDTKEMSIQVQASDSSSSTGPERSIKNSATERQVPIHPKLLELGFLEFIAALKKSYKNGPLFPSALPELNGKSPLWGRANSQAFLRHVRDKLGFGHGFGNHSFRHALEDRIREAKVQSPWPDGLSQCYTGRTSNRLQDKHLADDEGSEKAYGSGYSIDAMRKYISKIEYPQVALPPPFLQWLDQRAAVSPSLIALVTRWKNAH